MRSFVTALCAAGVMMAAGAAQATVVTLTFDGTVVSGVDQLGTFGAAGADLTGDTFSAIVQFTAVGAPPPPPPVGIEYQVFGGPLTGSPAPFSTFDFTINGQTLDVLPLAGTESGQVRFAFFRSQNSFLAETSAFSRVLNLCGTSDAPTLAGDVLSLAGDCGPSISHLSLPGAQDVILNVQRSTASPISAPIAVVPEPSAWAMLILGFAGVGSRLRRRWRPASKAA